MLKIQSILDDKQNKKHLFFVLLVILIIFFPIVIVKVRNVTVNSHLMTMYGDSHKRMEQEVLRVIPVGSNVQNARRVMALNDFACTRQTNTVLECEQDNGSWFTPVNMDWYVEISLKNGIVTGAKVWITPSD